MVLLWMILLEVLLCAEAENVTEVRGQLGAEVNLNCSDQSSDTHWYIEIYSQLRAAIGRSLSSVPSYYSPDFETKFSILGNSLMIKNLTAEDCRLYYCGIKRDGSIQFVGTFRLVSDVPPPADPSRGVLQSDPAVFTSLSLNAVLVLVVICLSCVSVSLKRRISRYQANLPPAGTSLEAPQYEEIQLPPPPAALATESVYCKVQLLRSTLHQC
ncbi:uncharacterized protein LOC115798287 [Archocentrus centrarchus]|uniref:uncharacterized protein LOC115798287 n=1 Tax=Archocentrus centrarchus TaxID=63155 RepID=UPI0011EA4D23|nr:uncharacterized protein LOC115798287 [Archocentrus centrarchus]